MGGEHRAFLSFESQSTSECIGKTGGCGHVLAVRVGPQRIEGIEVVHRQELRGRIVTKALDPFESSGPHETGQRELLSMVVVAPR